MKRHFFSLLFGWLAVVCTGSLAAGDTFTLDLPMVEGGVLPLWLTRVTAVPNTTSGTLEFELSPPSDETDLALTIAFDEPQGGFLRLVWKSGEKTELLSANLCEGIAMANQRTILIKRSVLAGPGVLILQSSERSLGVWRMQWEWVASRSVAVGMGAADAVLVDDRGRVHKVDETSGEPNRAPGDEWRGTVIRASLTGRPVRIEGGVEFLATLERLPVDARAEVFLAGVPLDRRVTLWVNGQEAREAALEVPSLDDPGYHRDADGKREYVGWRKGALFIDTTLLKIGENQFQIAVEKATSDGGVAAIAVKNFSLQLEYPRPIRVPAVLPESKPVETAPPRVEPPPTRLEALP